MLYFKFAKELFPIQGRLFKHTKRKTKSLMDRLWTEIADIFKPERELHMRAAYYDLHSKYDNNGENQCNNRGNRHQAGYISIYKAQKVSAATLEAERILDEGLVPADASLQAMRRVCTYAYVAPHYCLSAEQIRADLCRLTGEHWEAMRQSERVCVNSFVQLYRVIDSAPQTKSELLTLLSALSDELDECTDRLTDIVTRDFQRRKLSNRENLARFLDEQYHAKPILHAYLSGGDIFAPLAELRSGSPNCELLKDWMWQVAPDWHNELIFSKMDQNGHMPDRRGRWHLFSEIVDACVRSHAFLVAFDRHTEQNRPQALQAQIRGARKPQKHSLGQSAVASHVSTLPRVLMDDSPSKRQRMACANAT